MTMIQRKLEHTLLPYVPHNAIVSLVSVHGEREESEEFRQMCGNAWLK